MCRLHWALCTPCVLPPAPVVVRLLSERPSLTSQRDPSKHQVSLSQVTSNNKPGEQQLMHTNILLVTLSELIKMRLIKTRLKFKILGFEKKETFVPSSSFLCSASLLGLFGRFSLRQAASLLGQTCDRPASSSGCHRSKMMRLMDS